MYALWMVPREALVDKTLAYEIPVDSGVRGGCPLLVAARLNLVFV
jgi:hypothetical protein